MILLPREQLLLIAPHLRDAIYHLTSMWDALSAAETALDGQGQADITVTEDDIASAALLLSDPADALRLTNEQIVASLIDEKKGGA